MNAPRAVLLVSQVAWFWATKEGLMPSQPTTHHGDHEAQRARLEKGWPNQHWIKHQVAWYMEGKRRYFQIERLVGQRFVAVEPDGHGPITTLLQERYPNHPCLTAGA